jgi:sulfur-oxidizing protein SoxB
MTSRREFLQMLAVASGATAASGLPLSAEAATSMMYDPPRFGNLSLLQIGDTHAQMLPAHVREASFYMGAGEFANHPPYLVGEDFCEHYRVMPQSLRAHAMTHLYFEDLAQVFGTTGGYAHIATVIRMLRASRPESLLFDCGDSWLGSGLALRTRGKPLAEATRLLGVDAMTGDWEFALGSDRLNELIAGELKGRTAFLGQNVQAAKALAKVPTQPYQIFFVGGTPVGVIGEAYPHIGTAGGRAFARDLDLGIDEEHLQDTVDAVRAKGGRVIVLLSHAGLLADAKLAERVAGIDVILSGHSHDALPEPMIVRGRGKRVLIASVGSHGKFVGVMDLDVRDGRVRDYQFKLIPVFSRLVEPDAAMADLIAKAREPWREEFEKPLAKSDALLYRRHSFMGSVDQMVLQALLAARDAQIAFGPGYRWGSTILPGETMTFERILDLLAIPDAAVRVETLTGEVIRAKLEGWLDAVFNPDPYRQTGEDMVRALGLTYACDPAATAGKRVTEVRVAGAPIDPAKRYRVVSWGLDAAANDGENVPVWQVVTDYLKRQGVVRAVALQLPAIAGTRENRGVN